MKTTYKKIVEEKFDIDIEPITEETSFLKTFREVQKVINPKDTSLEKSITEDCLNDLYEYTDYESMEEITFGDFDYYMNGNYELQYPNGTFDYGHCSWFFECMLGVDVVQILEPMWDIYCRTTGKY